MQDYLDIVGIKYRPQGLEVLSALKPKTPLLLLREPQNMHDPNAILALVPLGYVKATQAQNLAKRMDTVGIDQLKASLVYIGSFGAEVEISDPLQKDLFHDL